MATRPYDYGKDTGSELGYNFKQQYLPAAGQASVKSKAHQWKCISLGKQYDHAEWPLFDGRQISKSKSTDLDHTQTRMDPVSKMASAGVSSRRLMKAAQVRKHEAHPGDDWHATIANGRCRKLQIAAGDDWTPPIESMQHKGKGEYNYDKNDRTDPITHIDVSDWKSKMPARGKKHLFEGPLVTGNPILHENEDDSKYFLRPTGKKHVYINGKAVLGSELQPSRATVKGNDRKQMHACERMAEWEQIDGRAAPKWNPTNESEEVFEIMDRGSIDGKPPARPRRSKSVDMGTTYRHEHRAARYKVPPEVYRGYPVLFASSQRARNPLQNPDEP